MPNTNEIIPLRVHAGSSKNFITKRDTYYELWVTSQAHNNQANLKVIELLSTAFNVPKTSIKIIRGLKSNYKLAQIIR
jgi:uncharacterized protein YggU (UPF0235/DUF167 family)